MIGAVGRRLIKLGNGLYIAIPAIFARLNKLSKGDRLLIKIGRRVLKIQKLNKKEKAD